MAALTLTRAVFLDRDGTLNRPPAPGEYLRCADELELLGGAGEAVALLRRQGYACVVVSNQRGVALGRMSERDLAAVDRRLHELVSLDGAYYCTHGLDENCGCRKPRPGLLRRAARELGLDLARSWMIGDTDSDIAAGLRAGCATIKVTPTDGALLRAARAISSTTESLAA